MHLNLPMLGVFNVPRLGASVTAGTAMAGLIRPFSGGPLQSGKKGLGYAHVTKVCVTTAPSSSTQTQLITIMRPFNYALFAADAAASQATVVLDYDPGLYATAANWRRPQAFPGTPRTANNAIAANDYVVYQAADGTWVFDTVASGTYAALVLTANCPTGGVKKGGLLYFFGVVTDSDPNTGVLNPQTLIPINTSRDVSWAEPTFGVAAALHGGDPMIVYNANAGTTGDESFVEFCSGYYANF